ncbi:alpha/beta hydrolase [uncultured Marinobacter sp.]|uniref:alpha/beta hydrolase n=1 Tax=uncultured Marinobacter sp. TaxID=187379 RepID=UPI00263901F0|nr:alpha/beta hydrolase [uncultured Marinobacter sp.]
MQEQPLSLNGQNSHTITGTIFSPDTPRSVLVIAHGMAEHAGRYIDFARWLAERGIAVVTMNHRGHGLACTPDQLGHYSDTGGWEKVVDDLNLVLLDTRARFPEIPLALLGHSMGSFIAQSCAQQYPDSLDVLILSATNRINRPELWLSELLISGIRRFHGKHHRSPTIAKMSFGKFNRMFEPNRTDCDWLSRDTAQVDKYIADPLCGFECTTGLWHDFIQGMLTIKPSAWRKDLPVHLFSGTDDPVGEMGKGVTRHFEAIRQAGVKDTSLRLFEGGRHEMLNETNVEEVRDHVLALLAGGNKTDAR